MLIPLICVSAHRAVPALVPGDVVRLSGEAGALTVSVLVTHGIMHRIGQAIRDGALTLQPGGPGFEELAAHIEAEHRLLLAQLDAAIAASQARRATAIAPPVAA